LQALAAQIKGRAKSWCSFGINAVFAHELVESGKDDKFSLVSRLFLLACPAHPWPLVSVGIELKHAFCGANVVSH
jgi:hypothetical protein